MNKMRSVNYFSKGKFLFSIFVMIIILGLYLYVFYNRCNLMNKNNSSENNYPDYMVWQTILYNESI